MAEARRRSPGARRQGVLRRRARRRHVRPCEQLLASPHVRKRINDPMFDFGQRAAHVAAKNAAMLAMLIDAGADVNLKSDWENGPYTVLDNADEDTARFLLARGATLTPNVAARLGWFDELQALVTPTPRSSTRAEATASSRSTRRRPSRSPTSCWTAAPTSTCAASITSPRRRSTRWSIARTSAGACSSAGPRPTSSWPRGSGTSRSGHAPAGRRSGLRRRPHQRARLPAGSAFQHLLLVARVRHVSARGRVEVRSSRCPRSARGPKPGTDPIRQRPPDRGRARGEAPFSPRIRRSSLL